MDESPEQLINLLKQLTREEQEAMEAISNIFEEEIEFSEKNSQIACDFKLLVNSKTGKIPSEFITNLKDIDILQKKFQILLKCVQAVIKDRSRCLDKINRATKFMTIAEPHTPTPTVEQKSNKRKFNDQGDCTPDHVEDNLEPVQYGKIGLINIRNTCYMNVTLQCLRHIPKLSRFYCSGKYQRYIQRPPVITNEVAHIIQALWTETCSVIKPTDFYNKFTSLAPQYKQGLHEDCMEFFLQLFTYLSEDTEDSAFQIPAAAQKNWHQQHGGKMSFYIKHFYHQIKIQQICNFCKRVTFRYETDNMFYLPVPDEDFKLVDCMDSYMNPVRKTCEHCNKDNFVKKTIDCYPRILVIALKRHISEFVKGKTRTVSIRKNENECYFPIANLMLGNYSYELNAIALHIGTTQSGHYKAACVNPINHQWYLYNDEKVSRIDNIHDPKIRRQAYAFFYSIKLEDPSHFY